ncbi:hypothetical protein HMPREF1544_05947 [Mucor circinelloides 1006PhL]|uniref:Reverse transcriptase zinc-binding domain-containing protein n=1 Tax=Mucor circinelloides f. circinelloides (strain 1006PhL) TaxID=1220926 RepID=S2K4U2_MUCC1|nr:hypothetical protein HMPREF1544_05947 [Mucor circinelloides 1006PhL]
MSIVAPLYKFLRAVDAIHRQFGVCHVSISTCLRLRFSSLIEHCLPSHYHFSATFRPPQEVTDRYPGVLRLTGNDVLTFDTASQALIVRTNTHGPSHPTSRRPAIRLLQTQQVLLTNFMHFNMLPLVPRPTAQHIDISPITNYSDSISHVSTLLLSLLASSFSFESHAFILSSPTTQGYKSLSIKTDPSFPSSSLGAAKWKQFWSLQILPLNARNTWFRILHNKVVTPRALLHQRLGDRFSPSSCPHCQTSSSSSSPSLEDTEHFLFSCPYKLEVWRQTLSLYLSPRFCNFAYEEYLAILHFRLDVDRSSHALFPDLSVFQVFACIQQAIWSAHYRHVFQHVPFIPSNDVVIYTIHRTLHNLDSQLTVPLILHLAFPLYI